jgi:hypothetical protein
MALKILFFILLFTLSIESAPTNCKTCKGFFLLYHDLKSDQAKKDYITKLISKPDWFTFPFEHGIFDLVKKEGVFKVLNDFNNCQKNSCIRDFCSKLSGKVCNYI